MDYEQVATQLDLVAEELREKAYDALQRSIDSGDQGEERQLQKAIRGVEKALHEIRKLEEANSLDAS